jgi:hypothetical protein
MEVGILLINVYEYGSFAFWEAVSFTQIANVQVERAGVPLGGYIYVLILLLLFKLFIIKNVLKAF